jgi:hypothetical protein
MISGSEFLLVIILFVIYGLIISGTIFVLRLLKVPLFVAVWLGFLIFGIVAGFAIYSHASGDISVIINIPASLLGDKIYVLAIQYLGDPHSSQAHYTIPWILRVPQVYVLASVVFWGITGFIIQTIIKLRGCLLLHTRGNRT